MRWICEQEGIQTDDETLAVLAQAGEGSVRDSLSALDQAIACCGTTLSTPELRSLLGIFSAESLHGVTDALQAGDSVRMLELVQELERNGQNLQHFCRELARYFRNLLVAKVAGGNTKLISASVAEQEKLAEVAAAFSEEDLTRYLKLTLDLFRDLQFSLQPRLHLEVGLLRLVHAGRLFPIEQAIAGISGKAPAGSGPGTSATGALAAPKPAAAPMAKPRTGPSPFASDSSRKASAPPPFAVAPPLGSAAGPIPAPVAAPTAPAEPVTGPQTVPMTSKPDTTSGGDLRELLYNKMTELGMAFTADALEHSEIQHSGDELTIITPKEFSLSMQEADVRKAAQQATGRPMRVKIVIGAPSALPGPPREAKPKGPATEDEVTQRALSHPDVQKFQEMFPDAQVRAVHNLKE
jgi:DNA polymerase-3 subunit gamma/tau